MRVGIIGTRGIPNKYGGFEQFTMHFAKYLAEEGIEVVVYNSSNHPYKENRWNGVEIVHCWDPEKLIGSAGQFFYDLGAILNARKQKFDVLFQLGYTSSSIWGFLFPKKTKIITNMDGQEWKRAKYNKWVKRFLKKAECWAIKQSDVLIADSRGIQEYLKNEYSASSHFIAYGANVVHKFDKTILDKYNLLPNSYNLLIARMEPENNIETIIKGHRNNLADKLIVIGNLDTTFGKYLASNYSSGATVNDGSCIYEPTNYTMEDVADLNSSLLNENSGIIVFNDHVFTINDGGNSNTIFELDTLGSIIREISILSASNVDWEAISQNSQSVFVGDFGNNSGSRENLCIYEISKADIQDPSLNQVPATRSVFRYEDQIDFTWGSNAHNYDCEAFLCTGSARPP